MTGIYDKIVENRSENIEFVICIITKTNGSVPRKAGAKMLVYPDGKVSGTIGGGRIEKKIIEDALICLTTREITLLHYDLSRQLQMSCGGSLEVYLEPIMKKNKLFIFGAGHTGSALARRILDFDFEITIIDDRKEYLEEIKLDGIHKVCGEYNRVLRDLSFDSHTYITILTYSHQHDREILRYCLDQPHSYLGMLGSRRKVELTKKMLSDEGMATLIELERVDMPMGIEIGADGPDEISISIIAKILAVKNKAERL